MFHVFMFHVFMFHDCLRPAPPRATAGAASARPVDVRPLRHAVVAANDVGELVGHVIVVAADGVLVAVALVEIGWGLAPFAVGAVDRKAVERIPDQRRMLPGLVLERRVHTLWV